MTTLDDKARAKAVGLEWHTRAAEAAREEGRRAAIEECVQVATRVTDTCWDESSARHGNKGVANMNTKVGHRIEEAIRALLSTPAQERAGNG